MEELLVKIRARDDKRFELLRTCKFISDQTFQENGCINSYLAHDNDNENIIIRITSYNVCYTKLLRLFSDVRSISNNRLKKPNLAELY